MAVLDAEVRRRALEAARVLGRMAPVRAAYLFGSHVEGRHHRGSDIDVALFLEGIENWDIRRRARAMAQVQREAGLDIEAHLFSAKRLETLERGSFAEYIVKNGVSILPAPGDNAEDLTE